MVGYTESLTDPSYSGQILVLTYPLIGNYGVPARDILNTFNASFDDSTTPASALPLTFESSKIHISALVIGYYSEEFSHFLAASSLGDWLKENGIPAIYGVDTRALTKRIREKGSLLARILSRKEDISESLDQVATRSRSLGVEGMASRASSTSTVGHWREDYVTVPFSDPNVVNLVADVSLRKPQLFTIDNVPSSDPHQPSAPPPAPRLHPSGRPLRVLAIDVGMKYNQIRCFTSRGVELYVVPWNYDFIASIAEYDGVFISNGPGDPTMLSETIDRLRQALLLPADQLKPMFGICLGHQLLALAAGATTSKMKYGNRGHNIPCTLALPPHDKTPETESLDGRCYITSQNHGFQVNVDSLPDGWSELFKNANDGSNEGIISSKRPFFSVQFHPESTPGPRDTEWLFDAFVDTVDIFAQTRKVAPVILSKSHPKSHPSKSSPIESTSPYSAGSTRIDVKKVLILGSGGLSIGQAGEFDYSGSQAIKALKEEGIYTILVNPNIATIATSKGLADKVYFLPVNPEFVRKIIKYEQPDGIYVTFGGQTALNVGIKLKDEFANIYGPGKGVKVLGTPIDTIITTEDRELFARAMEEIGEKCAESATATTVDEALAASHKIGFPVIVRAAYALGGLGSGFAANDAQLRALCEKAFATSPQVLVEKSMKGWKEIEYEVVRDCRDNCITVCNMEVCSLSLHSYCRF